MTITSGLSPWVVEVPGSIPDVEAERAHRKRMCALGYRVFGALRWGQTGDGHISARDPELTDHFWLLGHGIPFREATVDALVLVSPEGDVVRGSGAINVAAHHIHQPILARRPAMVSAAHTHTPYGTPFSAQVRPVEAVSQEACLFVGDQALFDDEEVEVMSTAGGGRIADAMGDAQMIILRNHGLLTAGTTVGAAVGGFVLAERVAEVHIKAGTSARPISPEAVSRVRDYYADKDVALGAFNWLVADLVPDPTIVDRPLLPTN